MGFAKRRYSWFEEVRYLLVSLSLEPLSNFSQSECRVRIGRLGDGGEVQIGRGAETAFVIHLKVIRAAFGPHPVVELCCLWTEKRKS